TGITHRPLHAASSLRACGRLYLRHKPSAPRTCSRSLPGALETGFTIGDRRSGIGDPGSMTGLSIQSRLCELRVVVIFVTSRRLVAVALGTVLRSTIPDSRLGLVDRGLGIRGP